VDHPRRPRRPEPGPGRQRALHRRVLVVHAADSTAVVRLTVTVHIRPRAAEVIAPVRDGPRDRRAETGAATPRAGDTCRPGHPNHAAVVRLAITVRIDPGPTGVVTPV